MQVNQSEDINDPYKIWKKRDGLNSTCGFRSWKARKRQNVISFSLFGNNPEYWKNLDHLLKEIKSFYPNWFVRIYTLPQKLSRILCPLLNKHKNLHICDASSLPSPLDDIRDIYPFLWRVAPIGDPLVDVVLIRDSDAVVSIFIILKNNHKK